jgi:hypothetical protein
MWYMIYIVYTTILDLIVGSKLKWLQIEVVVNPFMF